MPRKRTSASRPKAVSPQTRSDLRTVSLPGVAKQLRQHLRTRAPVSYDRGRLQMRDALVDVLECSPARAEHIVSSLVARGYARFGPHPYFDNDRTVGRWTFHPSPN